MDVQEKTLISGKNAVAELLKSGEDIDTVYVADSMNEQQAGYYIALAKQAGAVVKTVNAAKLTAMCGQDNHQGIVAYAAGVKYVEIEDILNVAKQRGEQPFVVLCDGIEDPHNLGAVLRTALLAGAHGVIIPRRGGVSVTAAAYRASAGAASIIAVARVANIGEAVRKLKKENLFAYCADMDGRDMCSQNLTGPIALVVGSEGQGVSQLVAKLCDGRVGVFMSERRGGIDSLNASVAAGVIMYEIVRQRMVAAGKAGR